MKEIEKTPSVELKEEQTPLESTTPPPNDSNDSHEAESSTTT